MLTTIANQPGDDLPRKVYADWLEENGGVAGVARAEFIRVQCEPARGSAHKAQLEKRQGELLGEFREKWLAGLDKLVPRIDLATVRFKRGFPELAEDMETAIAENNLPRLKALLECSPTEVNDQRLFSGLMRGADEEVRARQDIFQFLFSQPGININKTDYSCGDYPPLYYAISYNIPRFFEMLIKHPDIDVNAKYGGYERSLLHLMARGEHRSQEVPEILAALLKRGADVNAQDENGLTPLMSAIHSGQREVFDALIKQPEIDLTLKDGQSRTAMDYVQLYRNTAFSSADLAEHFTQGIRDAMAQRCTQPRKHPRVNSSPDNSPMSRT